MVSTSVEPNFFLLAEQEKKRDPVKVIPHVQILGPGKWNGKIYTYESIKEAYELTDWNNPNNVSLFLDHVDKSVGAWVGILKVPTLEKDGIWGDLAFYDMNTSSKLDAGMPFGVSVKVSGIENPEKGTMEHYTIENVSIVTNPACKMSYINNAQEVLDEMSEVDIKVEEQSAPSPQPVVAPEAPSEELKCAKPVEEEKKQEETKMDENRLNEMEKQLASIMELLKKLPYPEPAKKEEVPEPKEEVKEDKPVEVPEEKAKEPEKAPVEDIPADKSDAYPYPEDKKDKKMEDEFSLEKFMEKLSDSELSVWNDFVVKMRKEKPGMSFKDISDEFKKQKDSMIESNKLSQELSQLKAENEKLKKDLETPAPITTSVPSGPKSVENLSQNELDKLFIDIMKNEAMPASRYRQVG